MGSTHTIVLLVSATLNAASAGVAVPDGCSPAKRTFGLNAGYVASDRVALQGSVDGGAHFTPVLVNGTPVILTGGAPQITIDNGCEFYRTVRAQVGSGSTLATMGGVFTEDTGGSAGSTGSIYGDGSDGAVTVAASTLTLTRDMYYTTLDVAVDGQIDTKGYRIFATEYINNAGGIECRGGDATSIAGAASAAVLYGLDGGNGNAGGGAGNPGQSATGISPTIAHAGGAGGGGAGGVGGAASSGGTTAIPARDVTSVLANEYIRSHGGGGGGGAGDATTGDGGGGGGGGGPVFLIAPSITNVGQINVRGGNGSSAFATNSGGGGGGGAGSIFYVGETIDTTTATHNVNGGNGGAIGGVGTGVAGSAGTAGVIRTITVSA
jgi:hypothetical protein